MKALTTGGAMVGTIAIVESDRIERISMFSVDTSFPFLEEGRKTEALESPPIPAAGPSMARLPCRGSAST